MDSAHSILRWPARETPAGVSGFALNTNVPRARDIKTTGNTILYKQALMNDIHKRETDCVGQVSHDPLCFNQGRLKGEESAAHGGLFRSSLGTCARVV